MRADTMHDSKVSGVVTWLTETGRLIADPLELVAAFSEQLNRNALQISRFRIGFRTIHPQIAVWAYWWSNTDGKAEIWIGHHGIESTDEYQNSPIQKVLDSGTWYQRKLTDLDPDNDHRLLHEQARQGGTDYLAIPTQFSDGTLNISNFTSSAPGGFDAADVNALVEITKAISPIIEIHATRQIATTLLNTYVGPRTGVRIMKGAIKRGDGETIQAALWFSDLRDFTPLTETLPPDALLAMLNCYFENIASSVVECGGEILRFIGDAMLIVFPMENGLTEQQVCQSALTAARQAFEHIGTINKERAALDQPPIKFGVGLHFGDVIYGNVGSADRLDFTVMGPAVNRTARLESLTKKLGHSLLLSAEMATLANVATIDLGHHEMKGVTQPQPIFALA